MTTPHTPGPGHSCPDFRMSRRRMLGTSLAVGGGLATAQMFGDAFRQVVYGAEPDGNVVVVLSFRGGADGLSIVVPRGDDWDNLKAWRPNIAVPEAQLLGTDSRFGLHPSLQPLMDMWNAGSFGAVHSVGLPVPNRSHFDAMVEIEDADPGSAARVGWINRVVGLDAAANPEDCISLGATLLPTSMIGPASALGAYRIADLQIADLGTAAATRRQSLSQMWSTSGTSLGGGVRVAVKSVERLSSLVENADDEVHDHWDDPTYPEGPLKSVLANTAALIRANLGTRMIAIDYGDWDMHEGLGASDSGWMHDHLGHFAASLKAFFDDLGTAASRVTVVTISEFGRRVEENGSGGIDHGYGNAMLLLGAGVKGKQVHGAWPGLAENELEDGDLAVRQDYRSVLWEVMASRFSDISGRRAEVFPGFTPEPIGSMS